MEITQYYLNRMSPSLIALALLVSGETVLLQCVMDAGCSIRDSTPPKLTASTTKRMLYTA